MKLKTIKKLLIETLKLVNNYILHFPTQKRLKEENVHFQQAKTREVIIFDVNFLYIYLSRFYPFRKS